MNIVVDPPSWHYASNKLFDYDNEFLNRDGTLLPFVRLKNHLDSLNKDICTADMYDLNSKEEFIFISFSEPRTCLEYEDLISKATKSILVLYEPELVRPRSYKDLKTYGKYFDYIYTHNIGQIPKNLHQKHRSLFFPQAFKKFIKKDGKRLNKAVMIAGAHYNYFNKNENYSERMRAIAKLSKNQFIDLYGNGWGSVGIKMLINPTYFLYKSKIKSAYKGAVKRKDLCYANYDFAICFENQDSQGYITEKIFDCLLAGCIPVYKGAPNINEYIPSECFIDFNEFSSYSELELFLKDMSDIEKNKYRKEAESFLKSDKYPLFYDALENIYNDSL